MDVLLVKVATEGFSKIWGNWSEGVNLKSMFFWNFFSQHGSTWGKGEMVRWQVVQNFRENFLRVSENFYFAGKLYYAMLRKINSFSFIFKMLEIS